MQSVGMLMLKFTLINISNLKPMSDVVTTVHSVYYALMP